MHYREITIDDAQFLTRIFSIPEYDLYFAENTTSEEDWKERIPLFEGKRSLIVFHENSAIGWLMYALQGEICSLDIIVLLPEERYRGYGKEILADLLAQNPQIKQIKLDVQQRNQSAVRFYQNQGFWIVSEEYQPVDGEPVLYYNMELKRKNPALRRNKRMTTDIQLRSVHKDDCKNVQKMFIEFNASEFGKYDPIENTDDAHVLAFLENMAQNHVIYAVTPINSDEMIGYICFHIAGEEYDIGYMIASEYRGAGIAAAASQLAMKKVNKEKGAIVFTATVAAENAPSVRVLEKLGFSLVSEIQVRKEKDGMAYTITERRYEKRFPDEI